MYVLPGSLHELLAILKQGLKKGFLVTDSGCVDRGQMTSYLEFVIRIPSLYRVNLFTRSNTSDNGRQCVTLVQRSMISNTTVMIIIVFLKLIILIPIQIPTTLT